MLHSAKCDCKMNLHSRYSTWRWRILVFICGQDKLGQDPLFPNLWLSKILKSVAWSVVFSAPVAGATSNLVAPMVRSISSKLVKREEEGDNKLGIPATYKTVCTLHLHPMGHFDGISWLKVREISWYKNLLQKFWFPKLYSYIQNLSLFNLVQNRDHICLAVAHAVVVPKFCNEVGYLKIIVKNPFSWEDFCLGRLAWNSTMFCSTWAYQKWWSCHENLTNINI